MFPGILFPIQRLTVMIILSNSTPSQITSLLEKTCHQSIIQGAQWMALKNGIVQGAGQAGQAYEIYDLASLTKPLATALACLILKDQGKLDLDTPVSSYLSELDSPEKKSITVRQMLTHTAGFAAWRPFYLLARHPDEIISAINQIPLEYEAGSKVVYSDLGYIVLGKMLEKITITPMEKLFQFLVTAPLNLKSLRYCPPKSWKPRIAPTEIGNQYEQGLAVRTVGPDWPTPYQWRTTLIQGEVHDGNAFFLNGGAGHAGLFGSIQEVAALSHQFLPGSQLLQPSTLKEFCHNDTPGQNEARSPGWMLAQTPQCSAGNTCSPHAFGHVGFTGTSLWIDPESMTVTILLANRTFPIQDLTPLRRQFHSLATTLSNKA